MIKIIPPNNDFMKLSKKFALIDIRSPKEFMDGHIIGAKNIPLFSNTERTIIGKIYKQDGRKNAIKEGIKIVSPHAATFIDKIEKVADNKTVILYCARGGMRSKSVSMLLDIFQYTVYLLEGGFKAFKNYLRAAAKEKKNIILLGGKTGSQKTKFLQELKKQGEQVLDLEKLANHKGSVFGALGEAEQPTQQQFIINTLTAFITNSSEKRIWIEQEAHKIGNLFIPQEIWQQMVNSPIIYLEIELSKRIENLIKDYGSFNKNLLKDCIKRLESKIGSERTKKINHHIEMNNQKEVVKLLLEHYDKFYNRTIEQNSDKKYFKIILSNRLLSNKSDLQQTSLEQTHLEQTGLDQMNLDQIIAQANMMENKCM